MVKIEELSSKDEELSTKERSSKEVNSKDEEEQSAPASTAELSSGLALGWSSDPGEGQDLAQLLHRYGSDKDRNGYAQCYTTLFDRFQHTPLTMLEIGIGTMIPGVHSSMQGYALSGYKPGGSLRAWRDFLTKGRIIGFDVQPDTQFSDEERIETYLCNSTDLAEVDHKLEQMGNPRFDIILDDGSHIDQDQLKTLANLYPHLKPGGIYIIEDIYPSSVVSSNPNLVAERCNNDPFFFVGLKNNICVIYKRRLVSHRENY